MEEMSRATDHDAAARARSRTNQPPTRAMKKVAREWRYFYFCVMVLVVVSFVVEQQQSDLNCLLS
jgi:hypothetical protein